jgi:hypothetical protein
MTVELSKVEYLKPYIAAFEQISKRINKSKYEYKYEYQNAYTKFYIVIPLDTVIQINNVYPNLQFEKSYINIYPNDNRISFCYKNDNIGILVDIKPIPNEFLPANIGNTLERVFDLNRFILWKIKQILK